MKKFTYYEPKTVGEACSLLGSLDENTAVLAGGTDVIVRMNKGMSRFDKVVNIKALGGLAGIREEADGIAIGALTKLSEIARSAAVQKHFPAFAKAVNSIGTNQIRNLGTLGGNLCNASPCADSVCPLIVLSASFRLRGEAGERTVPADGFFTGPGKTVRTKDELLTEVFLPFAGANTKQGFDKLGPRKSADIAIINLAAAITAEGGVITGAKLALGSVAPTAIRAKWAEALLVGKKLAEVNVQAVGEAAAAEVAPITDVRGTIEYRKKMAENLTRDLVAALIKEF